MTQGGKAEFTVDHTIGSKVLHCLASRPSQRLRGLQQLYHRCGTVATPDQMACPG